MIPFYKAHGLGNDFLIIDPEALLDRSEEALPLLARQMCDRHRGIGADGTVFVFPGTDYPSYDFSIRLFNSDGSEAEMSGNGIRCAAAVHHWKNPAAAREVVLGSVAGRRVLRLVAREGAKFTYAAEMGIPSFLPEEIPFATEGQTRDLRGPGLLRVVNFPLSVENRTFQITAMLSGILSASRWSTILIPLIGSGTAVPSNPIRDFPGKPTWNLSASSMNIPWKSGFGSVGRDTPNPPGPVR